MGGGRSAGRLAGGKGYESAGEVSSGECAAGWLAVWLASKLAGWLTGWLAGGSSLVQPRDLGYMHCQAEFLVVGNRLRDIAAIACVLNSSRALAKGGSHTTRVGLLSVYGTARRPHFWVHFYLCLCHDLAVSHKLLIGLIARPEAPPHF